MKSARKSAYIALLITAIIWGLAPPIIKNSLNFISPIGFLFYRFLIVSVVLAIPLVIRLKHYKLTINQLLNYLFLGFLGTPLALYFLFSGMAKTTAVAASVIWIIAPLLVVIGGAFFLKERVTKKEQIGITLALSGTMMTIIQPLLSSKTGFSQNIWGNILVLLGTMCWAGFTLLSKKEKLDPFILSSLSFLVGVVLFLPLFLLNPLTPSPQAWGGILYMVFFGSIIAYFTYLYGVSKIEASEATIFTYLQPLFAIPLAAIWLKEPITASFLLGAGLIGLGVFISGKR